MYVTNNNKRCVNNNFIYIYINIYMYGLRQNVPETEIIR